MKWSGPSIWGILSTSNDVPRSRERERMSAGQVRDVGVKHSFAERTGVSNPVNQKTEVNPAFQFLHKASLPCRAVAQRRLVIPAEFAETKTAAGRRRMWRTRQAHGSHRPSPAGGGIFVAIIGKDFKLRAGATWWPSATTMPRRRRWGALN
jgi:hypothetical protein